ncbi:MAG: carbon-nitrogen hydrolase family protein [Deltaproteobacteria bacterium]|nr:carbon-nitrogen hydrolase family protein [Deltaproteobacteria bacterium]
MRFHCLQLPHVHGDPVAQLARLDAALAKVGRGEVALLPELALTGYVSPRGDFDLGRFAEPIDGPLGSALSARAQKHGVWLAGGVVEKDGKETFNTMTLHDPTGALAGRYRKRHPWFPETWATAGRAAHPVLTLGRIHVALAICYDLHFLASEAEDALERADVLLFSSAWVEDGGDERFTLLPELARRFSLWIVNCNWGPGVPAFATQGRSLIIAPDGTIACEAAPGADAIAIDL